MKKNFSKTTHFSRLLTAALLVTAALSAGGVKAATPVCSKLLWVEVKMLARECLAQEKAGRVCEKIRLSSRDSAYFVLHRSEFRVTLRESAYSDGGDLNDIAIEREDGCRLMRRNVPAYGDILQAMAH